MNSIPWIALGISVVTLLLSFVRFGREVHLDDKREILSELARCNQRCTQIQSDYDRMIKENERVLGENSRLREENYRLMQRITSMNGGPKP